MRTFFHVMLLAGMGALIASCAASPPPYQPATNSSSAGYAETRIEGDRFRVTYTGRSTDGAAIVQDLALLRAAELTRQYGYDWFIVVSERVEDAGVGDSGKPRVSVGLGTSSGSYGSRSSVGLGVGFGGGNSQSSSNLTAILEVKMGSGDGAPDEAYDAREVETNIRGSVLTAG